MFNAPETASLERRLEALRLAEAQRLEEEDAVLQEALSLVAGVLGSAEGREALEAIRRVEGAAQRGELLREALTRLLGERELVGALLSVLRARERRVERLDEELSALVELELVRVRRLPVYVVEPSR